MSKAIPKQKVLWVNFINHLDISCSLCFNDDEKAAKRYIRKLHSIGIRKAFLIKKINNRIGDRL